MSWLLYPEVLSLTIAILALVGVLGLAFAFGVHHRLAWAQLPAAVRDAELATRVVQREAELLDKEARIQALNDQIRDREAKMLERDQLEAEADYWKSQVEAMKAEFAGLDSLRTEIEEVRETYRQELENLTLVETQVRETTGEAEDARNRVAEAERRLEQIAGEEECLRAAHKELSLAVAEMEARLTATKAERAAALEALERAQDRVSGMERQIEALAAQHETLRGELSRNQDALARATEEIGKLESQRILLKTISAEIEKAELELAVKQQATHNLNSEEAWLNTQVSRLKGEAEALKAAKVGDDAEAIDDRSLVDLITPPACLASDNGNGTIQPVLPDAQREETEQDALQRVGKHLRESGLVFDQRTINAFHTCLKTAAISPLTVLAGISGTGKSQLPRFYADAMGIHFLKIPVQPRWDGPQDLFGFYNYIEKRYKATDLARAMVHLDPYNWRDQAKAYEDRMLLVLLDEMNLARVEYYFSEFLSRLEGRPFDKDAGTPDVRRPAEIEIDVSRKGQTKRVYAGQNILFSGTMNEDESTLTLSDKVLDRANMLRFPKPKELKDKLPAVSNQYVAKGYLPKTRWTKTWMRSADSLDGNARDMSSRVVSDINAIMDQMGRPFGHRMGQAMQHYVANYPLNPGQPGAEAIEMALADQIELRILPRLRGVLVDEHRGRLNELADVAKRLKDDALASAIDNAIRQSGETNGLFVWRGFTRQ